MELSIPEDSELRDLSVQCLGEASFNSPLGLKDALYNNDAALASEIMGDTPFTDARFVNFYASRGQYNKVLEVWQYDIHNDCWKFARNIPWLHEGPVFADNFTDS